MGVHWYMAGPWMATSAASQKAQATSYGRAVDGGERSEPQGPGREPWQGRGRRRAQRATGPGLRAGKVSATQGEGMQTRL